MHVLYHGTTPEVMLQILRAGFRAGTCFTAHFDSAVCMGGSHVFSVVFDGAEPTYWEWITPEPVPPDRILALREVTLALRYYAPAAQALLRREGKAEMCPRCNGHGELNHPEDGHHLLPGGCAWGKRPIEVCPDCEGYGDLQHPILLENRRVRAEEAACGRSE